jgi:hypothetical protein
MGFARMDGTAVVDDNSAGRDCGKADRTRVVDDNSDEVDGPQSQWVDDGNDWVDGTACWDFGKADRTREADRTRKAATAVGTVGTVVAGGTSSCVRCGIGGLFGGD